MTSSAAAPRTFDELLASARRPREPLSRDRALRLLADAKRQMRRPRQMLRQICTGTVDIDALRAVPLQHIHRGCSTLDADARAALEGLLLHVERNAPDLLSVSWGCARLGPRPGNSLVDGLVALAGFHTAWRREPGAWRPRARASERRFAELTRHLLAGWDVPTFLDSVWFRGSDAEARRQQGWFVHLGGGANLRTADLPWT